MSYKSYKKNTVQCIVVAGLLLQRSKILLLKRNANEKVFPNLWELPSGKKEIGETTQQALKREFQEETSLDIVSLSPISVFDYKIAKDNKIRETTQINFLVRLPKNRKKEVKTSKEHSGYKWVGQKDLNKLYVSNNTKQVIIKILKGTKIE